MSTEQAVLVAIVDRDEAQLLLRLARVRDQVATMSRYGFGERVTARSTLKDPGRMESSDAERYLLVCRSLFARPSRPASVYRTRSFRLSVARSQQAPEMMKTYSHIRREALNQAAVALEPSKPVTPAPGVPAPAAAAPTATHVTKADFKREGARFSEESWLLRLDSNQQPSGFWRGGKRSVSRPLRPSVGRRRIVRHRT